MSKFEESNFYKALQDFFINADKKTFLQFLAEFYNRTEGIIDKNEIQDDLIKELSELYLEFNEKGIDENIVREKVNYFLENSLKIKDIISKLDTKVNKSDQKSEMVSRRVRGQNNVDSPAGTFDFANFAKQGQETGIASTPIGGIIHHYTDGKVLQIDNVGENNVILTMVTANNPTRRPDKDSTFYGNGYFLQL